MVVSITSQLFACQRFVVESLFLRNCTVKYALYEELSFFSVFKNQLTSPKKGQFFIFHFTDTVAMQNFRCLAIPVAASLLLSWSLIELVAS